MNPTNRSAAWISWCIRGCWGSHVILQIFLGTLVPLALLAANQLWTFSEARRKAMYMTAGGLTLIGIFAMRWNVVIGGQLFSKSFLGYTTYKMELVARGRTVVGDPADASSVCDFFGAGETPAAVAGAERPTKPEEVAMPQPEWETLEREVRDLAVRVASLERHVGLSAPAAPPEIAGPVPLGPSAGRNAASRSFRWWDGRCWVWPALTCCARSPNPGRCRTRAGIATGIAYAMLWLGWAARKPGRRAPRNRPPQPDRRAGALSAALGSHRAIPRHRRLDRRRPSCWSSPFSA